MRLRPLEHSGRGLESRYMHGCMSVFIYVALSCVRRGLSLSPSFVQEFLPKYFKGFIVSGVNS